MGENVELVSSLKFKDVKVKFAEGDADIVLDYTMALTIHKDMFSEKPEYYDEMRIITTLKARADDDVVYMTILEHKLDVDSHLDNQNAPMQTTLDINTAEYREFLSSFGFYMNFLRKYINNVVLKDGIQFPYNPKEIYTTIDFKPKQMHVFMELADDAGEFFEDELWDDAAK